MKYLKLFTNIRHCLNNNHTRIIMIIHFNTIALYFTIIWRHLYALSRINLSAFPYGFIRARVHTYNCAYKRRYYFDRYAYKHIYSKVAAPLFGIGSHTVEYWMHHSIGTRVREYFTWVLCQQSLGIFYLVITALLWSLSQIDM